MDERALIRPNPGPFLRGDSCSSERSSRFEITAQIGEDVGAAGQVRIRTPDQRIRVFISSTLGELAAERHVARDAVEQLRLTPVMFELGARPHPPRALYRSYLAQSDVFVGIYWQRYGWVAPDMDISGLEDELLLSAGMPRLVYVKRPAPEMESRLSEMLRRLEGDEGPSYKPFGGAAELHDLLLDDLALLLSERFGQIDPLLVAERRRSNLPAPTSTFVGRRAELEALRLVLDDDAVRLITLAGPGGTGKTRLAIEAARAEVGRFDDGVFFVDLAAERQVDEAFGVIARTLEIGGAAAGSPLERVERELGERNVLLVLDNVEQVTTAGPWFVELLEHCPRVKILATSRETLRVTGEHVFPVPVMSLPAVDGEIPTMDDVLRSEAGRLFSERASAVGSQFAPTTEDAADVAAICYRLDGLPLALELAAARVKLFSVAELRNRLEKRLDLLTGGGRDLPDRQRTLRDTIEWSNDLLTSEERTAFQLLSVFSGGRLGDIEETLGDVAPVSGLDVVEALSSLVDKNLVRVIPGADRRPRFSMLQTIREFAAEQLAGSPELLRSVGQAHATHYVTVALDLHRQLTYADRSAVLALLGAELGNLRAAWDHWVKQRDVARLDDLLEPLWGYYEAQGDYRAAMVLGEDLLRTLAELPETRERRHDELALRANLARTHLVVRGFSREAELAVVDTLERSETFGAARQRFPALRSLAALHLWRSDFEKGAATAQELMVIAQEEQDPALLLEAHLMSCISSSWLHDLPAAIDDADRAAAYFDVTTSGFVEFRVGPNPGVVANAIAGLLRWTAGLPDAAVACMRRALDLADELQHPYSQAFALHHATLLDLWRSDVPSVEARAEESRRLADTHDYAIWRALALVFRGSARVSNGHPDAGLAEMEQGFTLYQELTTPPIFWPALLAIRATTHGTAGHVDHALALIETAWTSLGGDHPAAAEVAIAHGDLLLAASAGDVVAAQALFERAAVLSADRRARMVELQALTRLATVHCGSPAGDETLRRLRSLYETFTEGFATPQLQAAATLLKD
jgi:predicted ATPase